VATRTPQSTGRRGRTAPAAASKAKTKPSPGPKPEPKPKIRREDVIIEEAIRFFADVGFNGQTRELAKRLGITQPALYKHFVNKNDLIEKVYQAVFLSRWSPYWERVLDDKSLPVVERLTTFYQDYAAILVQRNWIRITMQAALAGDDLTRRYVTMVGERIVPRVCHAIREHVRLPKITDSDLTPAELQLVWDLQGSVIYLAIRQHVYGFTPLQPLEVSVRNIVQTFVHGAPTVFASFAGR